MCRETKLWPLLPEVDLSRTAGIRLQIGLRQGLAWAVLRNRWGTVVGLFAAFNRLPEAGGGMKGCLYRSMGVRTNDFALGTPVDRRDHDFYLRMP
jgi:hypothetical protein